MDEATGLCAGCFRTLDEIAHWGSLPNPAKREILVRVDARRETAGRVASGKQSA